MDENANREVVDEATVLAYLSGLSGRDDLAARGERTSLLRMLGRLEEAELQGRAAYESALREGTSRQQVAALLRLAHVLQYRCDWVAADQAFGEALRRAKELGEPLMLAFAHQHAGRNHVADRVGLALVAQVGEYPPVMVGPPLQQRQTSPCSRRAVVSCSRPGRTGEVHSGHLCGAVMTCTFPPCWSCLPDHHRSTPGVGPIRGDQGAVDDHVAVAVAGHLRRQ